MTDQPADLSGEPTDEDLIRYWENRAMDLMFESVEFAKRAQSWRDFQVGCAVLAFRKNAPLDKRFGVFFGANVKVAEDVRPVCAEMAAILAARYADYDRIIGVALCGEPLEDQEHRCTLPFLHPCVHCRKTMEKLSIVTPQTRILSVWFKPVSPEELEQMRKSPGLETISEARKIERIEMDFAEMIRFHKEIASRGWVGQTLVVGSPR